jgi:hypothetical protein
VGGQRRLSRVPCSSVVRLMVSDGGSRLFNRTRSLREKKKPFSRVKKKKERKKRRKNKTYHGRTLLSLWTCLGMCWLIVVVENVSVVTASWLLELKRSGRRVSALADWLTNQPRLVEDDYTINQPLLFFFFLCFWLQFGQIYMYLKWKSIIEV